MNYSPPQRGKGFREGERDTTLPKGFVGQRDSAFSPAFDDLVPAIVRWVADNFGRLQRLEGGATPFGRRLESDAGRLGWMRLVAPRDRRRLIEAAVRSPFPPPLTVTITLGQHICQTLVRMAQGQHPDGSAFWYGTIEDIHDHPREEVRALRAAVAEGEQHYRSFIELSPQVPWTANPAGGIEDVGPRWEMLTGMVREDSLDDGWIVAVHPDDRPRTLSIWMESLASGRALDLRYRVRVRDGSYRWMRARAAARRDASRAIMRWYGTLEDVHEAELAEQALAEGEQRLRLAVLSARLGIWDYDCATNTRIWSPEFRAIFGLSPDQPATTELALSLVHPQDRHVMEGLIALVAEQVDSPDQEMTLRINRADTGEQRWIRTAGWTKTFDLGDPTRVTRAIATFRDVTVERDAEDRIRWAATHDPLTDLPNRALWQTTLESMAAEAGRSGKSFGLMLLDIDELKRINDTLGHDAGDALLRSFAERLLAAAPDDAMVGRLGGDEFGLIAPSLGDSDALCHCSTNILAELRRPAAFAGRLIDCGASIGGAVFGQHGDDAEQLLKAADLALYASKGTGRGRLTLFDPSLRMETERHSAMILLARDAIEHCRIRPYYQPRIDMRTGRVLGCEALLRWEEPGRGIQLPGRIAAAFDHPEIAVTLTQIMLAAVVKDIRAWLDAGIDPGRVAINASAADFARGNFADTVLESLARAAVPTGNFEIEVTETVFLGRGASHVEQALVQFSREGVRIALDDFGTGYASLSHLKQYPVDVLKIDRSFVRNLETDRGDEAIIDAIVKLGDSLRIEVVAEGVETVGQRDILLHHGCTVGQGFLLAYPQPAASIRF